MIIVLYMMIDDILAKILPIKHQF